MRVKRYILYFLILILAGAIAVSIFFAVREGGKDGGPDVAAGAAPDEEALEAVDGGEIYPDTGKEEDKQENDGPELLEDHYSSSSTEFKTYTFRCPGDWSVFEEDLGRRVVLKSPETGKSLESIMIMVEDSEGLEGGPEDMISTYMDLPQSEVIDGEIIDYTDVVIDNRPVRISGYYYESGLAEKAGQAAQEDAPGETDLITCISDSGFTYIIKYMSSGIDKETAGRQFKDFLDGFFLSGENMGSREPETSGSVNILILGVDSGMGREWGRSSARSDINMIVHINLETYGTTIVTIPRDLWVPIPGHGDGKINGAHAVGGPELAVETFEKFSGLEIDNYIVTDFDGFIPLIDYLGGVTVEVNEDLADGFSNCYLSKGVHHLNGEQALALCRNRHRNGDGSTQGGAWAREREAAKVIQAVYEQKTDLEKILAMPAFVNFLLRYTWSDMGFMDIIRLLPVLGNIQSSDISIRGVPSYSKMIGKASAVVHYQEETSQLFEEIKSQ